MRGEGKLIGGRALGRHDVAGIRGNRLAMRFHLLLPGVAAAALLGSCATAVQGPADMVHRLTTSDPTKAYLGMTKEELIACAGQPHSRYAGAPGSETLSYHYSGAGPVPSPDKDKGDKGNKDDKKQTGVFGGAGGKKDKVNFDCVASFVFDGDSAVRITFAHKNVDSPYAWQKIKDPVKAEQKREEGVPTCTFSLPNCPR